MARGSYKRKDEEKILKEKLEQEVHDFKIEELFIPHKHCVLCGKETQAEVIEKKTKVLIKVTHFSARP